MLDLLDPQTVVSLLSAADTPKPMPEPDEVKAGPIALMIWLGLAVVVGFLGWSLTKQLRRTQAAKEAGVYGDDRRITAGPAWGAPDADDETDVDVTDVEDASQTPGDGGVEVSGTEPGDGSVRD